MKPINSLLAMLFVSLLSSPSWSETMDDLVKREGLYYEKFTDVPYTGKVTGSEQGAFKSGKREGYWVHNDLDGLLFTKGTYENGKEKGAWVYYWDNGQLWHKGEYKKGKKEGTWVYYHKSGQ